MSAYIDGSFVAQSSIKKTAIKESFNVFLGVDDGIIVRSRPESTVDSAGTFFSKNKTREVVRKFIVKNTKTHDVVVNMFDQLPKSSDSKIKVRLIVPTESSLSVDTLANTVSEAGLRAEDTADIVVLNQSNNVRWSFHLAAGAERVVDYQYAIDYPPTMVLSVNDW